MSTTATTVSLDTHEARIGRGKRTGVRSESDAVRTTTSRETDLAIYKYRWKKIRTPSPPLPTCSPHQHERAAVLDRLRARSGSGSSARRVRGVYSYGSKPIAESEGM